MQDPNQLIFDSEKLRNPSELLDMKDSLFADPDIFAVKEDFADSNPSVPKVSSSVKDDIAAQKAYNKNKIKADIFNTLFANEMQLYFDEHKHVMPSDEKRRLKSILIKKINKGDIYVNKVGKLIIRKGKNK